MGKNKYGQGAFRICMAGRTFKVDKWQKSDLYSILQELERKHCIMQVGDGLVLTDSFGVFYTLQEHFTDAGPITQEVFVRAEENNQLLFVLEVSESVCSFALSRESGDIYLGTRYTSMNTLMSAKGNPSLFYSADFISVFGRLDDWNNVKFTNKDASVTWNKERDLLIYNIKLKGGK